jgi:UDP-2,4-diacetamido-2,4,6-trideoxy-beta-L-altropyranose hydrolase
MNIAFRVDAGRDIGTGHVMRCLALAEVFRERGCAVLFLCRELDGNLNEFIRSQKGFDVAVLTADLPDAQQTANILQTNLPENRWDWLVVDHYGWTADEEMTIRPFVRQILVIDDLADRNHDCDLLVDQNYFPQLQARYARRVPSHCELLLGPKYALLRSEFAALHKRREPRESVVRKLLISFGGSDPTGETLKVLHALQTMDLSDLDIQVILGAAHADVEAVEAIAAALPQVSCYRQVNDMAERMLQADLFIGAGGITTWERMALGLPGLVIAVAENQVAFNEALAADGYQLYLGVSHQVTEEMIRQALSVMLRQPGICKRIGEWDAQLVDGFGCSRVIDRMMQRLIVLRPAVLADSEPIFLWRNHEETRQFIFQPEPIAWEVHERWFRDSLNNPNRHLLIGERDGLPVGVLRYDVDPASDPMTCLVSVYRVPGLDGPGIGTALLQAGSRWLEAHVPQVCRIEAAILPGNIASVKAFEKAGYRLHHSIYEKILEVPVSHE